jgi:chromosome segregation ATPase
MKHEVLVALFSLFLTIFFTGGCQKAYYGAMEKFGVHKRDIMVDRVEEARDSQQEAKEQFRSALEQFSQVLNYKGARDSQQEAKEQFRSALEQFSQVLNYKGGKLEDKYKTLQAEYDKSEAKADEVRYRIDAVEDVSEALFDEWEDELDQYTNKSLQRDSERKLVQTRRQYDQLIKAMRRADPVLKAFRDQVLYLKHNLNAQAIASLQSELVAVESDIADLIKEMEKSIGEANSFIRTMLEE